ncbi:hypothetical protein F3F20_20335 [Shigella flexneri]|nr:hypothetical protein [Shigella flexneri]
MFHTIVSIKNDGHYFCRAGGNRPDGLNEPVTSIVDRLINLKIFNYRISFLCSLLYCIQIIKVRKTVQMIT